MRKLCVDQSSSRRTLINQIANPYFTADLYDIFNNQIRRANGIIIHRRSCVVNRGSADLERPEELQDT